MEPTTLILLGLGACSLLAGIVGSILPMLPGPQLSALGNLLIQAGLSLNGTSNFGSWTLCITSIIASIILAFVDFIAPQMITKMGGASKTAGKYAMVAMIIVFMGSCVGGSVISTVTAGLGTLPAILIGLGAMFLAAFVGGMMGELKEMPKDEPNRNSKAIKAGLAHTLGIIGGMVAKIVFSLMAVGIAVLQMMA
jgi:uncharacterized protein YqgC (DUF456 family)